MQLTLTDARDPDVCLYNRGVPVVYYPEGRDALDRVRGCPCAALAKDGSANGGAAGDVVGSVSSPIDAYGPRTYIPPFDPNWTREEERQEEVRRLCWSALALISQFEAQAAVEGDSRVLPPLPSLSNSHGLGGGGGGGGGGMQHQGGVGTQPRFYLADVTVWQLLYPGEASDRTKAVWASRDGLTTKESLWGLYCRSMLLWNYCRRWRMPGGPGASASAAGPPSTPGGLGAGPGMGHGHGHAGMDHQHFGYGGAGPGYGFVGPGSGMGVGQGGGPDEERFSEELTEAWAEASTIEESLDVHKCALDSGLVYTTREHIHK